MMEFWFNFTIFVKFLVMTSLFAHATVKSVSSIPSPGDNLSEVAMFYAKWP